MFGLGWLLAKTLRLRNGLAIGSNAALGLALTTIFAHLLTTLSVVDPIFLEAYLLTGMLLALFAAATEIRRRPIGVALLWRRRVSEHKSIATGAVFVAFLILARWATTIPSIVVESQHAQGATFRETLASLLITEAKDAHLMDAGVALVILILLLAELMMRKRASAPSAILLVLAVALFQPPVSETAPIYSGVLFFVLLFGVMAGINAESGFADCFILALAFASITLQNASLAPAAGGTLVGYFGLRLRNTLPGWQKVALQTLLCVALAAALLSPLMLSRVYLDNSLHGAEGSTGVIAMNASRLPEALAPSYGTENTLFVIFAIQAGLLFVGRHWRHHAGAIDSVIASIVILSLLIAGLFAADGRIVAFSLPIIFSAVLYFFTDEFATPNTGSKGFLSFYSAVTSILLLGIMLGTASEDFIASERDWLSALKSSFVVSL